MTESPYRSLWELNVAPDSYGNVKEQVAAVAFNSEVDASLWHRNMGHFGAQRIRKTLEQTNEHCQGSLKLRSCVSCKMEESTRAPFTLSVERAKCPFERIHVDIAGTMSTSTYEGWQLFLIIVDDCTKHTRVCLMKKNDNFGCLKRYIVFVGNQTSYRVQTLRSDNDNVLTSRGVENWCAQFGIHNQKNVVCTPQQNGVAERHIRSVKEMANRLIQHAFIEFDLRRNRLWGYACL